MDDETEKNGVFKRVGRGKHVTTSLANETRDKIQPNLQEENEVLESIELSIKTILLKVV